MRHALLALLPALCAACSGGSSGPGAPTSQAQLVALAVEPLAPEPGPFGLIGAQTLSWQAGFEGEYELRLLPAGDPSGARVLEQGSVAALGTIEIALPGWVLPPQGTSRIVCSLSDGSGRVEEHVRELKRRPVETLPLGPGLHSDLALDRSRGELFATERFTGIARVLDVRVSSPNYGQQIAIMPPGPDVGPWRVGLMPDGRLGFHLYRSTMLEYDLQTLQIRYNLFLPGAFEPSGLAVTPDSSRVYIGYPSTLLSYRAFPSGSPPQVTGTGIFDGLVTGGDVAISPDGAFALYAWYGLYKEGLWVVDVDPTSLDFQSLLSERSFDPVPQPEPFGAITPRVSIPPSGEAAYVGGLSGINKVALTAPDFPTVASRPPEPFIGLAATTVDGEDFALAWDVLGGLRLLDEELLFLAELELPPFLLGRSAIDQESGRLFLIRQQQETAGSVLVVPLR